MFSWRYLFIINLLMESQDLLKMQQDKYFFQELDPDGLIL